MKRLLLAAFLLFATPALAQNLNSGGQCASTQVSSCQFITGNTVSGNATGKGRLYEFQVNNWSTAQSVTVIVIDSLTVPTSGATVVPIRQYGIPVAPSAATPAGIGVSWVPDSIIFNAGITILCSTAGPTTYTPAATCTFSGAAQ